MRIVAGPWETKIHLAGIMWHHCEPVTDSTDVAVVGNFHQPGFKTIQVSYDS